MDTPPEQPRQRPVIRQGGEPLVGRQIGDRRLRLGRRPETQQITPPKRVLPKKARNPAITFVLGFAAFIVAGTILLMLPFSSASGQFTHPLVALFTATSAVCVTGLVVVDTGTYWSAIGQVIILVLIQAGGFGFMASSTLLLLLLGHRASLRQQLLLREAVGARGIGLSLQLTRRIILFTVVAEAIGMAVLFIGFIGAVDPPQALWWALFHSVSAFNNAGFDLTGGYASLVGFNHNAIVLLSIAALLILGGISYTVVEELLVKKNKMVRWTLDTKLVVFTTGGLIVAGIILIGLTEWRNPSTLGSLELGPRLLNLFFQAVSPRTAGFNSVPISDMTEEGLLAMMALMFIGGASGSTAGGIKVQTFSILFFAIVSAVRGLPQVVAYRREVPTAEVMRAIAIVLIATSIIVGVAFVMNLFEVSSFVRILFEATSAFGTVGLSTGITPDTSAVARILLILTMFAGRLGPLTLVLAVTAREHRSRYHWPQETVKIG